MEIEKKDYKKINELKISKIAGDFSEHKNLLNELSSKYGTDMIMKELESDKLYIIEWYKAYEN